MIVKKYGSSSLANNTKIKQVAKSISLCSDKQIVVVSAPYGMTNKLISCANDISPTPSLRELDQMLVTGEMLNASLLAIALIKLGVKAISLNAYSLGIYASSNYGNALIKMIDKRRIEDLFLEYDVIVVTGFQGINNKEFVTLGRGGSDTTALALSAIFKTDCLIYTDVSGVYTIDPRESKRYLCLKNISFDQMLELSLSGGKVLSERAAVIAKNYLVSTKILKSLGDDGTNIVPLEENGPKAVSVIYLSKNKKNIPFIILNNKSYYKNNEGNLVGISIVGDFMLTDNTDKILQNALKKTKIRAYSYVFKDNFLFVVIKRKNKSKLIDELALRLPLKE